MRLLQGAISTLRLGKWLWGSSLLQDSFVEAAARVPFTQLANLAGLPAISVPAFRDGESGLPVGVMLSGPLGADGLLLQLAAEVESSAPWAGCYPFAG